VCRSRGEQVWINEHFEIGFVPVIVPEAQRAAVESLVGTPVVARGRVADAAPVGREAPPADATECPGQQWRSDWVRGPDGVRSRRSDGPGIAAFEVDRVEPFAGLTAARNGETIDVELVNPLTRSLAGPVELVAHYEGCYGKPGTRTHTGRADGGLAPRETIALAAPVTMTDPDDASLGRRRGRGTHRADSIEVRATGDGIYFDLDVPLSALGDIAVECPK
jgi:hypothetical protein